MFFLWCHLNFELVTSVYDTELQVSRFSKFNSHNKMSYVDGRHWEGMCGMWWGLQISHMSLFIYYYMAVLLLTAFNWKYLLLVPGGRGWKTWPLWLKEIYKLVHLIRTSVLWNMMQVTWKGGTRARTHRARPNYALHFVRDMFSSYTKHYMCLQICYQ